jgi:pimeloyl-ACP methyl ester carboxylesterase
VIYLHGIADNRGSAVGAVTRFTRRGLEVVAYDSRAHGQSDGESCTFGYFEKEDLRRVIRSLPAGPIMLLGTSLGGAVALQAAVIEPRVSAVIAAEVFSDLDVVARERAPFFLTRKIIVRAFAVAEKRGRFRISDVSPRAAAAHIRVPVLLIHGAADHQTRPAHSIRVYDALNGTKRLLIVEGAGHNESLKAPAAWEAIDNWVAAAAANTAAGAQTSLK